MRVHLLSFMFYTQKVRHSRSVVKFQPFKILKYLYLGLLYFHTVAEETSRAKILVKNTAWIYVGKLFTQLFGVIATILVIRKLAVDVFGTYNFLIKILLIYFVFALSPVMNLFNRYIPELLQLKDFRRTKKLIRIGIFLAVPVLSSSRS